MSEEEASAAAPAEAPAEESPADATAAADDAAAAAPELSETTEPAATGPQALLPAEVRAMGAYLGVKLDAGEHFLQAVAREAVVSPVLPPWEELEDDKGNPYFFNHRSRQSTRRHPLDAKFLKLVQAYREAPPPDATVSDAPAVTPASSKRDESKH